jgi:hypothetical protein
MCPPDIAGAGNEETACSTKRCSTGTFQKISSFHCFAIFSLFSHKNFPPILRNN